MKEGDRRYQRLNRREEGKRAEGERRVTGMRQWREVKRVENGERKRREGREAG